MYGALLFIFRVVFHCTAMTMLTRANKEKNLKLSRITLFSIRIYFVQLCPITDLHSDAYILTQEAIDLLRFGIAANHIALTRFLIIHDKFKISLMMN